MQRIPLAANNKRGAAASSEDAGRPARSSRVRAALAPPKIVESQCTRGWT